MIFIVGTIVRDGNKLLMVREGKQSCLGKWNFPSGHLEKGEDFFEGAIRETLEETGHRVILTRVLPIQLIREDEETICRVMFVAKIVQQNVCKPTKGEILEVKYRDIGEIKNSEDELRTPIYNLKIVEEIEKEEILGLDEMFR